ncbi:MAG TPA: hypothetical protein VG146_08950 [Verrucomicrobiae bacterium]|nr:hypothetical protein [Verrucomicrobiae bacterium]
MSRQIANGSRMVPQSNSPPKQDGPGQRASVVDCARPLALFFGWVAGSMPQ